MFIAVDSSGIWGEVASLMPPDIKGTELSLPLYALYAVLFAICCFGWTAASFRFGFGSPFCLVQGYPLCRGMVPVGRSSMDGA